MEPLAQEIPKPLAVMAGRFSMKDLSLLPIFKFFFPILLLLTIAADQQFPKLFAPASRVWDNRGWSSSENPLPGNGGECEKSRTRSVHGC